MQGIYSVYSVVKNVECGRIVECARNMMGREGRWENPFGDGKAGEKIVRLIHESYD